MSVIAWDGSVLAADKRVSNAGLRHTCTKIEKHNNQLYGITGVWDIGAEMREWHKAGADPEKFPAKARDDKATLIVINDAGVHVYDAGPFPMRYENKCAAWGSGRDFAEAAMFMGKTAFIAVEIACHFAIDCGDGVDTLQLDPLPF
jgi:ATP-dependent protease HslVU (ClpYQ) peptidase subunit